MPKAAVYADTKENLRTGRAGRPMGSAVQHAGTGYADGHWRSAATPVAMTVAATLFHEILIPVVLDIQVVVPEATAYLKAVIERIKRRPAKVFMGVFNLGKEENTVHLTAVKKDFIAVTSWARQAGFEDSNVSVLAIVVLCTVHTCVSLRPHKLCMLCAWARRVIIPSELL